MRNEWYKLRPAAWLAHFQRVPDISARGLLFQLAMICADEGPLPDDNKELAYLSGTDEADVSAARPYLARHTFVTDEGLMFHIVAEMLNETDLYRDGKRTAGKLGGRPKSPAPADLPQIPATDTVKNITETLKTVQPETSRKPAGNQPETSRKPAGNQPESNNTHTHIHTHPHTSARAREVGRQEGGSEGGEALSDWALEALEEAIEQAFPGEAVTSRARRQAHECALRLQASPLQIREWPTWMAANHPRTAPTAWNFASHFPLMLQARQTQAQGASPARCPRCNNRGDYETADGERVYCACVAGRSLERGGQGSE